MLDKADVEKYFCLLFKNSRGLEVIISDDTLLQLIAMDFVKVKDTLKKEQIYRAERPNGWHAFCVDDSMDYIEIRDNKGDARIQVKRVPGSGGIAVITVEISAPPEAISVETNQNN